MRLDSARMRCFFPSIICKYINLAPIPDNINNVNKITNVDWTPRPTVRVFFVILSNDGKIVIDQNNFLG